MMEDYPWCKPTPTRAQRRILREMMGGATLTWAGCVFRLTRGDEDLDVSFLDAMTLQRDELVIPNELPISDTHHVAYTLTPEGAALALTDAQRHIIGSMLTGSTLRQEKKGGYYHLRRGAHTRFYVAHVGDAMARYGLIVSEGKRSVSRWSGRDEIMMESFALTPAGVAAGAS